MYVCGGLRAGRGGLGVVGLKTRKGNLGILRGNSLNVCLRVCVCTVCLET